MTVEDPIEFLHQHKRCLVNQREVGEDTHSFANALKHVLRQDPDVILVGEMRDLETISVALTAAETGHLVFATLHTQDAAQTIDRVIDVFPADQQQQVRVQLAGASRASSARRCARPPTARAGSSRPRSWSPRRRSATSSARARPTRSTRPCRPARSTACTRWTSTWPSWCAPARSPTRHGLEKCHHVEDFNRLARPGLRGTNMTATLTLRVLGPGPGRQARQGQARGREPGARWSQQAQARWATRRSSISADERRHEQGDQDPRLRRARSSSRTSRSCRGSSRR